MHALALGVIAGLASRGGSSSGDFAATASWELVTGTEAPEVSTLVDLAAADLELSPPSPPLDRDSVVVPPPAAWADQSHPVPAPLPHPTDGTGSRLKAAPDRGAGAGRPLPDPAWRRDATTLHDQLSDGAEVNQPSLARTAPEPRSPQAVRREPMVGRGDSARTEHTDPSEQALEYGIAEPEQPGVGGKTTEGNGTAVAPVEPSVPAQLLPVEPTRMVSAQGPLDSEQGARSFDVEARGLRAAADLAVRSASREVHPSITELTLAAVSGSTGEGRGSSDIPGASPRPDRGTAATPPGLRATPEEGLGQEARTRARIYNRYNQEIGARVNQVLVFPRALAIRLEQGETVVRFAVLPDGNLGDSVRVVKSSGFAEFDQAALNAVRMASPFPPMRDPRIPRPLRVNLPVRFSNPVIR